MDDFDIILTELEDIMQLDSEREKPGLVSLTFLVAASVETTRGDIEYCACCTVASKCSTFGRVARPVKLRRTSVCLKRLAGLT